MKPNLRKSDLVRLHSLERQGGEVGVSVRGETPVYARLVRYGLVERVPPYGWKLTEAGRLLMASQEKTA